MGDVIIRIPEAQARGIEAVLQAALADPKAHEDLDLDGRSVRAARSGLGKVTAALDAEAARRQVPIARGRAREAFIERTAAALSA